MADSCGLSPCYLQEKKTQSYTFFHKQENKAFQACVEAIQAFIKSHPSLVLLFDESCLVEEMKSHQYLVVRGSYICFSDGEEAIEQYRDFFSLSILSEPVTCVQGHHLEKRFALRWVQKKNKNICPNGEDHSIDSLEIDKNLKPELELYKKERIDLATQEFHVLQCIDNVANSSAVQLKVEKAKQSFWGGLKNLLGKMLSTDGSERTPILVKRLDPQNLDEACKALNLAKDQMKNVTLIQENYTTITSDLKLKKSKASFLLAQQFQYMLDDIELAYQTLMKNVSNTK